MGFLSLLVGRYSYAKIASRFGVTSKYLRNITAGVRLPSNRIVTLSRNLYRTSQYNRLKLAGVSAVDAAKWRSRSIDFIDGMVDRYNTITKEIAAQRNTSAAVIRRSLVESDFSVEELEERYASYA